MDLIGKRIYELASKLFPICRSITGDGVRETLNILSEVHPIKQYEVPSGTQVFDWIVPKEWNVNDAWIKDDSGNKIVNFKNNNLHLMGYSIPVNTKLLGSELIKHLHSLPEQPNLIPYVTSYYKEDWGFCITEVEKKKILTDGKDQYYEIFIDSNLQEGCLTYGEILIPGKSEEEIFISTYVCHPSLANNELSGLCVAIYLAKWLAELTKRRYSYRIVFIPET